MLLRLLLIFSDKTGAPKFKNPDHQNANQMSRLLQVKFPPAHPKRYEIEIGENKLKNCGAWATKILSETAKKIVVISNAKVFALYGKTVEESLKGKGFEVFVFKMPDGERYKNFRVLQNALRFCGEKNLKRTDTVLALGGGVVGDLAGFAAAVYLRGVAFLQVPTTLLAQIDSSVGGKTAINTDFGKNLIGAFYQPSGVLIDVGTLQTLPRRELTAGFCEAVKQGAIADRKLFNQTADFLKNYSINSFKTHFAKTKFLEDLQKLIAAQVAFKAQIVKGDERENSARVDAQSRKILNFGHTVAHALEKVTDYRRFRHGEAVGYGILVAAKISNNIGIFDNDELGLLDDTVRLTGNLPKADDIEIETLVKAFAFDKKADGESLQWILLEAIGKPKIFQSRDISDSVIKSSLEEILKK